MANAVLKSAYPAPPFPEGLDWINTGGKELTLSDLRGKFILLDFWTYGCINCMHILPTLRRLEETYPEELVVIGVHSGKFTAERETDNIRTATRRLGIEHPVVNDKQFRIWRAFNVEAWPTVVLVGPDGLYMGQHAGEFTVELFSNIIQTAVTTFSQAGLVNKALLDLPLDPAPVSNSPLLFPAKVLADPPGSRLFISDTAHNRVLVADVTGNGLSAVVVQVIGRSEAGLNDGSFSEAALNHPHGLSLRGETLYIADTENHAIRAADLEEGTLRTVGGTGSLGYNRSGGYGIATALNSPWDVLVHEDSVYIAMAGLHQLWRLDLKSGVIRPSVGSGHEDVRDGSNARSALAQPSGLSTDGTRIYFADGESSAVRTADFAPEGLTQTLVGEGLFEFGDRDGISQTVRLQHCLGVSYYNNKVYIADTYNNKIKLLDLSTKECVTTGGTGNREDMYEPGGLSVWQSGGKARVYIADTNNHRILQAVVNPGGTLLHPAPVNITFAPSAAQLDVDFEHLV